MVIYNTTLIWDSPVMKKKNKFAVILRKNETQKIQLICNDYNFKGGPLGNIKCTLEGRIRDKVIPEPPIPLIVEKETEVIQ